ncbi:MAG: hypothetical protein LBL17_04975 [Coxiellaceae bacterium]|jgi:HemY protein|nr:hypothetical protein [Coxiellaceae bacterium]
MKRIIFYFLVLLFAVWFGVIMHNNPGYVLIAADNISIETSLWFAVVALVFLFVIFYTILRFGSGVSAITCYVKQWFNNRKKKRAHKQTVLGLYDLIEGNWERAERKLLRSAKHSDMPLVNCLASTFMAQHQHALKRRDSYLRLVQKVAQNNPMVVGLAQASLQIGNRQWKEASMTLQSLHQIQPKNVFVLQLLQQVYLELNDWLNLEKLLPVLKKRKVLGVDYVNSLEAKVYKELLLLGIRNNSIETIWNNLPRYLQKKPILVAIYVEYLIKHNKGEDAEMILKIALHKVLDERLLELYATLPTVQPIKHLIRAEGWLKDNSENASLLFCLGKICREQKLWGKAIHYLEKSAKIKPTLGVYAELGRVMVSQNDWQKAIAFYEKAIYLS